MRGNLVFPSRQRGVALLIGMVILVVLALLGASAYSLATQDERIAGNARDRARAAEYAELMLRECEHYVQTTTNLVFDGTSFPGMFAAPPPGSPWQSETSADWASVFGAANLFALPSAKASKIPSSVTPPQCVVEKFDLSAKDVSGWAIAAGYPVGALPPNNRVAHVAARGFGLNTSTQVTLVSYVAF